MNDLTKRSQTKRRGNAVFNPTYSERRVAPVRAAFDSDAVAKAVAENVQRVWNTVTTEKETPN